MSALTHPHLLSLLLQSQRRKKREAPILTIQHDDCYADKLGHSRLIRLPSTTRPAGDMHDSSEALVENVSTTGVSNPRGSITTTTTDGATKIGSAHVPAAEITVEKLSKKEKRKRKKKFPHLPRTIEALINRDEEVQERKVELQEYLQRVLDIWKYRNHPDTVEFLEISRLSFVHNLGGKFNEGLMKKRPGGRKKFLGIKRFCMECCARWGKRWLVIKDSFIVYLHPRLAV